MTGWMKAPVKTFFRALGYYPVTIRGRRFKADPYHLAFWNEAGRGGWERATLDALEEFLGPGTAFADIGAWIGPMAMVASRKGGKVFCFEPDPFAYECLLRNIRFNDLRHVMTFPIALGAGTGLRSMVVPEGILGASRTTLLHPGGGRRIEVMGMRWEDWRTLAGAGRLDFLKVDIEGGEFELVPAMRAYLREEAPIVHLSLHAPLLDRERRRENLETVLEVMGAYPKCYDEERRTVTPREILESSENRFSSFLFVPR